MLLLLLRLTPAMNLLLALHLGVVFALFITLPYSKFVHGLYRFTALVRYVQERRVYTNSWLDGGTRSFTFLNGSAENPGTSWNRKKHRIFCYLKGFMSSRRPLIRLRQERLSG